jgi:hypothetical protein
VTRELNNISKTATLVGMKNLKESVKKCTKKEEYLLKNRNHLCPYKNLSAF